MLESQFCNLYRFENDLTGKTQFVYDGLGLLGKDILTHKHVLWGALSGCCVGTLYSDGKSPFFLCVFSAASLYLSENIFSAFFK